MVLGVAIRTTGIGFLNRCGSLGKSLLRLRLHRPNSSTNQPGRWATLNPDFVQRIGLEKFLQNPAESPTD